MTKKKKIRTFSEKQIAKAFEKLFDLIDDSNQSLYMDEMAEKQEALLNFYSFTFSHDFNSNERRVGTFLMSLIWGIYKNRIKDLPPIPAEYIKDTYNSIEDQIFHDKLKIKQLKILDFINMFMEMADEFELGLKKVRLKMMPEMFHLLYVMIACFEDYEPTMYSDNIIQFPGKKDFN